MIIDSNKEISLVNLTNIQMPSNDIFDLNIKTVETDGKIQNTLITSRSLCTPGCGNTGSGNSFCC